MFPFFTLLYCVFNECTLWKTKDIKCKSALKQNMQISRYLVLRIRFFMQYLKLFVFCARSQFLFEYQWYIVQNKVKPFRCRRVLFNQYKLRVGLDMGYSGHMDIVIYDFHTYESNSADVRCMNRFHSKRYRRNQHKLTLPSPFGKILRWM